MVSGQLYSGTDLYKYPDLGFQAVQSYHYAGNIITKNFRFSPKVLLQNHCTLTTIHYTLEKNAGNPAFFSLPLPLAEKPIAMSASGDLSTTMEWVSWFQIRVSLQPFTSCKQVVQNILALSL